MLTPRPYRPADRDAFHAVLRDPALRPQLQWLIDSHELDDPLNHPFVGPAKAWVAEGENELAGFSTAFKLDSGRGPWSVVRVAVRPRYRRRGLGRGLLEQARSSLALELPGAEVKISYWEPCPEGEAFAAATGFTHDRYFWDMERRHLEKPVVAWPAGIEARTFDGSPEALRDWNDCSNAAFEQSPMSLTSTIEQCQMLTRQPHFHASGLVLAYRDGRCVGFCRCAIHPEFGDLDVLGVRPEARGIGLGRAVVRWGTAWLLEQKVASVRLTVDGENSRALELYRSEGFDVIKTRRIWVQRLS
ncbi:MAG TPA: GNAT family N-acetyltransferase [Candidatus Eisenbacteria bacterium]|nr:GNAT family N-acetyltransferase [Candidatus Eisenbacteria bacterium]